MLPRYPIPSDVGNKAYVTLEQNCVDRGGRERQTEGSVLGGGMWWGILQRQS